MTQSNLNPEGAYCGHKLPSSSSSKLHYTLFGNLILLNRTFSHRANSIDGKMWSVLVSPITPTAPAPRALETCSYTNENQITGFTVIHPKA